MRLTKKLIEKEIKTKTSLDARLQKEWNYFWFYSEDKEVDAVLCMAQSQSVTVFKLSDLSLDGWVAEFIRIYQAGTKVVTFTEVKSGKNEGRIKSL